MEINEDKDIEKAVLDILEDILMQPKTKFHLGDKLIQDLKMDSDDFSFIFVPELEKKLRVKVPVEKWSEVCTVQNAIDLLKKYRF